MADETTDEHVHEFIHPHEVFEGGDGIAHQRVLACECGAVGEGEEDHPPLSQMKKAELLEHAEKPASRSRRT